MTYLRESVERLHGYVPGEQPDDPNVLKLNTNENPYPPSPAVGELLASFAAKGLRLYPDPVCRALRESLAALHGCTVEQVFVGNGSDEVLALCIRAFVERDRAVGYFDPSYSLYPILAAIEDVATVPVPLDAAFGWVDPDPTATDLFFITNPNAPTSLLFPRKPVEAFCGAAPGVVVIDEAYGDFAKAHCLDLALSRDNVLVTRTLSKSYSLAGIRLGYAVGNAALIAALMKIKDSYNVNRLSQDIARAAVEDQGYFRWLVDRIVATRESTAAALVERGFTVAASQTNFLWVRPPGPPAVEWFNGLRERGVLIRHFPAPATKDWLRITVGTDEEMERFLAALKEISE